jgi:hypothetical protein
METLEFLINSIPSKHPILGYYDENSDFGGGLVHKILRADIHAPKVIDLLYEKHGICLNSKKTIYKNKTLIINLVILIA